MQKSEETLITIYSTKENIYDYLHQNLGIKNEKLKKIKEDEIDGEALIILIQNDLYKDLKETYGISPKNQEKILNNIEKDIFKEKKDIEKELLYEEIFQKDFDILCNLLEEKFNELKLGQIMRYIKYLIIKYPPNKDDKSKFLQYLEKILLSKDKVETIINDFDNLLNLDNNTFKDRCDYHEIEEKFDIFILKILVEYIKNKKPNEDIVKTEKINEKFSENIEAAPNIGSNSNNEGKHRCDTITYICKEKCCLSEKAKGCDGKCKLASLHLGEHNCGKQHMCKELCGINGCQRSCIRIYDHENGHDCNQTHYCIEDCYYKEIAKGCDGKCKLTYPHSGEVHNCGKQHKCKEVCSLKNKSTLASCNQNCSGIYEHSGQHICNINKNAHKCNQKCKINENCTNPCSLPAEHSSNGSKCLCGLCGCPNDCKYKNYNTINCQKKCCQIGGHEGEHKCQQIKHYCREPCKYKNCSSSGCNKICKYELENYEHHSDHICLNEMSSHKCNKRCDFYEVSRCENICKKNIEDINGHSGMHVCDRPTHKCIVDCVYRDLSSNCSGKCCKSINNNNSREDQIRFKEHTEHICSLSESDHKCNGQCNYYSQINTRCVGTCSKVVNHNKNIDPCKCSGNHICQKQCRYYNDNINNLCEGCTKICSKSLGHPGECLCDGIHKCKSYTI